MNSWFKEIPCPNCKRLLRYSTHAASTEIVCFFCKTLVRPNENCKTTRASNPRTDDVNRDPTALIAAQQKARAEARRKMPLWAQVAPSDRQARPEQSVEPIREQDNANASWGEGTTSPAGSVGGQGRPQGQRGRLANGRDGGGRVVACFVGLVLLVSGFAIWLVREGEDDGNSLAGTNAPTPPQGNTAVVARILSAESHVFAVEEYVLASHSAEVREQRLDPHISVAIAGLTQASKIRFALKCRNHPALLNAERHIETPQQNHDGSLHGEFPLWLRWNMSELTSQTNRDPMLEIQVECFVDDQVVLDETCQFHFNEIYVIPIDAFLYSAAYVQPDHPQIRALRDRFAAIDRDWDWDGLRDSMQRVVTSNAEVEEVSYKSILRSFFVWRLVDELNITYQNLPSADVAGDRQSQRLRTVDEVLQEKMGNCIEESILLASVLHATEGASLMSPPGHCLVMIGPEFDFFHAIPLECTALGRVVTPEEYGELLSEAEVVHSQSGLGRLSRTLQLMPAQMRNSLESDMSWRNYVAAIAGGTQQLVEVFTLNAAVEAWTSATNDEHGPGSDAWSRLEESAREARLAEIWSGIDAWFEATDSNYDQNEENRLSDDPIRKGLAYWYTVCLIRSRSENPNFALANYIPIAHARRLGIVALPNSVSSTGSQR